MGAVAGQEGGRKTARSRRHAGADMRRQTGPQARNVALQAILGQRRSRLRRCDRKPGRHNVLETGMKGEVITTRDGR